jgi:ureidoglycolate lyase
MPISLSLNGETRTITAEPLTPEAFAPFGDVLQNPRPDVHPATNPIPEDIASAAIRSEQVTAFKFHYPPTPQNLYPQAPSQTPSNTSMSVFVVASSPSARTSYTLGLLERHPFTSQSFIPMVTPEGCSYLVLVAPSLAPVELGKDFSFPLQPDEKGRTTLQGSGLPDLTRIKAFVVSGRQAVTYGAGTWHAPMVVLGPEGATMEFIAVQFANGVRNEDSQEVVFGASQSGEKGCIEIRIPDEGI